MNDEDFMREALAQARQDQAFFDWLGREVARAGVMPPPNTRTNTAR